MLVCVPIDVPTLVSIAGALGIGSILGQLVAAGKDRRVARAAVLQALSDVETARWAPTAEGEPSFAKAARTLRAAALIAQIPRTPVRVYLLLAEVAHWESLESLERTGDPELGGGISMDLADVVRDAGRALTSAIWAPQGFRWLRSRLGVAKVQARAAAIEDAQIQEKMNRARGLSV